MKTVLLAILLASSLASVGCSSGSSGSSDGPEGSPLSCNDEAAHVCISYGAIPDDERADYCQTGTVVPSCATDDVRAMCVDTNYTGTNHTYWYKDNTMSDHDIKFACDEVSGELTVY